MSIVRRDNRTVANVYKKYSVSIDVSLISWVSDNCSMAAMREDVKYTLSC